MPTRHDLKARLYATRATEAQRAAIENWLLRLEAREASDAYAVARIRARDECLVDLDAQIRTARDLAWKCGADALVK